MAHLQTGFRNQMDKNWHLDTLIRGTRRECGTTPKQKLPITPDILHKIYSTINIESPYWLTFWSACLVAFYGMLRKANVCYDPTLPESAQQHIRRKDIIKGTWYCNIYQIETYKNDSVQRALFGLTFAICTWEYIVSCYNIVKII